MASFLRLGSAAPCSKYPGPCATPVSALPSGRVSHSQQTQHCNICSLLPAAAAVSWPARPKQLPAGLLPAAVGPDSGAAATAMVGTGESNSKPDSDFSVYLEAAAQPGHFVGPVAVANIPGVISSSCTQHYNQRTRQCRYVHTSSPCLYTAPCSGGTLCIDVSYWWHMLQRATAESSCLVLKMLICACAAITSHVVAAAGRSVCRQGSWPCSHSTSVPWPTAASGATLSPAGRWPRGDPW